MKFSFEQKLKISIVISAIIILLSGVMLIFHYYSIDRLEKQGGAVEFFRISGQGRAINIYDFEKINGISDARYKCEYEFKLKDNDTLYAQYEGGGIITLIYSPQSIKDFEIKENDTIELLIDKYKHGKQYVYIKSVNGREIKRADMILRSSFSDMIFNLVISLCLAIILLSSFCLLALLLIDKHNQRLSNC